MENLTPEPTEIKPRTGMARIREHAMTGASENMSKIFLLVAGALAVLLAGGSYYWFYARWSESTDDAFIDGHILPINSKVAGQVVRVAVNDNQNVNKGDLLLEIDPVDYRIRLDQARAQLAAARADARRASLDAARAKQLFTKDEISGEINDHAQAAADMADANAEAARQKVEAAELDLANATIAAPEQGRVTKKSVELKSFVQVGQPLMALVTPDVWVTANFKETQLKGMRLGQKVKIHVDAFPSRDFNGHVDSFQMGTGSRFSLFPPENATGNYVKVVQRVPVKIVFDEDPSAIAALAPGMSVVPVVELK